jgi:hypothetical protein
VRARDRAWCHPQSAGTSVAGRVYTEAADEPPRRAPANCFSATSTGLDAPRTYAEFLLVSASPRENLEGDSWIPLCCGPFGTASIPIVVISSRSSRATMVSVDIRRLRRRSPRSRAGPCRTARNRTSFALDGCQVRARRHRYDADRGRDLESQQFRRARIACRKIV